MRIILIVFSSIFLMSNVAYSQCMLQKIPFNERVNQAELIVEGKVVSTKAFEDKSNGRIYTLNTIEVFQSLKGSNVKSVNLITFGGRIGDRMESASPSLVVQKGDVGVFLLDKESSFNGNLQSGRFGVSGPSSFVAYNKLNRRAVDAFETFDNAEALKIDIEKITGTKSDVKEPDVFYDITANKKAGITSFTNTVTAGNGDTLVIKGSGFNSTQGKVGFANGNDGGKTNVEVDEDYYFLSWSDTKIEVFVPQLAGTGKFYVVTSNSQTYVSAQELTVTYSRLQIANEGPSTNPGIRLYSPVLDNDNGDGGLTWSFNTDFFKEKGAVKAILRALQNWRCSTGVNFNVDTVNAVTNNTVARDDVHTIMWQNPNQSISTGALAVTFSLWSGCYNASTKDWHWYLNDVDMVFDDVLSSNRTWNYGPGDPTSMQYDLESVALHELGHAHQLGHIIDANGVMHYSIKNGEKKRVLNSSIDVEGGKNTMDSSTITTGCTGVSQMIALKSNCKLIDIVDVEAKFTISASKLCVGEIIWIKNASTPSNSNFIWRIPAALGFAIDSIDSFGYQVGLPGKFEIGLVVENSGFKDSLFYTITVSLSPEPNSKLDHVSCKNEEDGKATFILQSDKGTAPFTIRWKDINSLANPRTNMAAGTYFFVCKDASGCETLNSVLILEPDSLLITTGSTATWSGLNKGKAFINISGGTPPYKVKWDDDDAQKTDTAYGLSAGIYNVTVTDDNDCETKAEVTITDLASINENESFASIIYPNPTSGIFLIENTDAFITIEIYELSGRKVITQNLNGSNVALNVKELGIGKGAYIVLFRGENLSHKEILLVK